MSHNPPGKSRWNQDRSLSGNDYDAQLAARVAGQNPHGEADFVESLGGRTVLDAGCGTGRVGIELARRGFEVTGVDLDAEMLATARRKAPDLDWRLADLATLSLGSHFDRILLAGNVLIFLAPNTEGSVLERIAAHLASGGRIIAGFQLLPGGLSLDGYDRLAAANGLHLIERWATWHRDPWTPSSGYAVSVHGPADSATGR